MLQTLRTLPIDELRRNFGKIKKELPYRTFIITDRGKEVGMLSATPKMKKEKMLSLFGAWKGTELDNDELWKDVLTRHSRKEPIEL